MKKLILLLFVFSFVIAFSSTSFGDTPVSIANIVDISGVTTEVNDLHVNSDLTKRFPIWSNSVYNSSNAISISLNNLEIDIPIGSVKTIKVADQNANVVYEWLGQERTIIGSFKNFDIIGKNDFGDIKLSLDKIKEIVFVNSLATQFDANSKENYQKTIKDNVATVFFIDGTKIKVSDLHRDYSYWSHAGYLIGGEMHYDSYQDFTFQRGETILTLNFLKLQALDFGPDNAVTVTLANGNSTTGKVIQNNGWNGVASDYGWIYIRQELVKKIVFENPKD